MVRSQCCVVAFCASRCSAQRPTVYEGRKNRSKPVAMAMRCSVAIAFLSFASQHRSICLRMRRSFSAVILCLPTARRLCSLRASVCSGGPEIPEEHALRQEAQQEVGGSAPSGGRVTTLLIGEWRRRQRQRDGRQSSYAECHTMSRLTDTQLAAQ